MKLDRHIQEQVLAALEWEPGVHAEHIGVTVVDGVVTLQGIVTTLREKYLAERIARRLYSVRAVANDLTVAPDAAASRSDSAIAAAAANALEWDSAIPDGEVKATVRAGWVTLTGTVSWAYQRSAAERVVRDLTAVKGISNNVVIRPAVNVDDIKSGIEQAFRRSAEIDAERVNVDTDGRTIILTGKVHSLTERDAAERVAWSAPGVTSVDDRLVVAP
jgi:osmotically-inducible protein OsmY